MTELEKGKKDSQNKEAQSGPGSQKTAWEPGLCEPKKSAKCVLFSLGPNESSYPCAACCHPEIDTIRRVFHSIEGRWYSVSHKNLWWAHGFLCSPCIYPFLPLSNNCPLLTWNFLIAGPGSTCMPIPCLPLLVVPPQARCWTSPSFSLFLYNEDDRSPLS